MFFKLTDVGFLLIEVGAWAVIGKAILAQDKWNRLDAYWLWIGSPASAVVSFGEGLWLYGSIWLAWMALMFVKRMRREA